MTIDLYVIFPSKGHHNSVPLYCFHYILSQFHTYEYLYFVNVNA